MIFAIYISTRNHPKGLIYSLHTAQSKSVCSLNVVDNRGGRIATQCIKNGPSGFKLQ